MRLVRVFHSTAELFSLARSQHEHRWFGDDDARAAAETYRRRMSTREPSASTGDQTDTARHPHRVIATVAFTALVVALLLFALRGCEAITGNSPIPGASCTVTATPTGSPGPSGSGAVIIPTPGATGPAGPSGPAGRAGSPGPSGTCDSGDTGATGPTGAEGASAYDVWLDLGNSGSEADFIASLAGEMGPTGPQGDTGPAGAEGVPGPQGIQGEVGSQGAAGDTGATGATGAAGDSAYQVWLALGNSGTEADFIASLVGATGPAGAQGIQGETGPQGPAGTSSLGYYGSFYDTTTQLNTVPDTAHPMTLNTTDSANGVSITSGSHITFDHPGIYNIAFSAQLERTQGGNSAQVDIWLSYNGITVPVTNTELSLQAGAVRLVAAWNFFVTVTQAGDYYELIWSSNESNADILYLPPQTGPDRPAIPSVIVTVNQVQ